MSAAGDYELVATTGTGSSSPSPSSSSSSSSSAPPPLRKQQPQTLEIDYDEDDEEDEEDDNENAKGADRGAKELEDLLSESIFGEVGRAVWDARYLGPVLALVGIFIGYQMTIAPYRHSVADYSLLDLDLKKIRPMLTTGELAVIRSNMMNAETEFDLPLPSYDKIKLRFHAAATTAGIHQPPELFYRGVTFGISNSNAHELDYTRQAVHSLEYTDMRIDLLSMRPTPTNVMAMRARRNDSGWHDEGYAVHFSYADLAKQGKLSSDKLQPWKRVLDDILVVARNYKQVCVVAWYPHEFGAPSSDKKLEQAKEGDKEGAEEGVEEGAKERKQQIPQQTPEQQEAQRRKTAAHQRALRSEYWQNAHMYKTMLQHVIPTRTGLYGLVSIVPVWMSAVNATPPRQLSDDIYVKEWDENDHWTHYLPGEKKHIPNLPPHPALFRTGKDDL